MAPPNSEARLSSIFTSRDDKGVKHASLVRCARPSRALRPGVRTTNETGRIAAQQIPDAQYLSALPRIATGRAVAICHSDQSAAQQKSTIIKPTRRLAKDFAIEPS